MLFFESLALLMALIFSLSLLNDYIGLLICAISKQGKAETYPFKIWLTSLFWSVFYLLHISNALS